MKEDKNKPIHATNTRDPGYICKNSIKEIKIILITSLLYHKSKVFSDFSSRSIFKKSICRQKLSSLYLSVSGKQKQKQ